MNRGFAPIFMLFVVGIAVIGITVFATNQSKRTSSQAKEMPASFHSLSDFIKWLKAPDEQKIQMEAQPFSGEIPVAPSPTFTITPTPWGRGECLRGYQGCDGNFTTQCVNGSIEHIKYCSYGCEGAGSCRTSPEPTRPEANAIAPTSWGKGECTLPYNSCDGDFTTECVNGSIERIYYCKTGCSSGKCIE